MIISSNTYKLIATFFGLGYLPKAPGTFGALGAMLISFGLSKFTSFPYFQIINIILITLSYFMGVIASNALKKEWGSDPSKVVIDEACGYWVTLMFLYPNIQNLILAFIFFRFFDILKPLGIKKIDNMHDNSHAVMLDDVVAGVYGCVLIHGINYFLLK